MTVNASVPLRSTIPARLDRLSWSPFHTRMVAGLGAAWILDGLQITISSSVTGVLISPEPLGMTSSEIGLIALVYLAGEMVGALVFGRMSDQLGRKRLLIVTLLLYLLGTGLAAFVTGHHTGWLVFFNATRFIAGMGIGGQYAAINSAIDEMMPSKSRGRVHIWINGTYWAGAIIGSFASLIFLNAFAINGGWRLAFLIGPVLALVIIVVGRTLPESPRWLMTHGRVEEAERELAKIEDAVRKSGGELTPVDDGQAISLVPEKQYGYLLFLRLVFREYPKRHPRGHADNHPVLPVQRHLLHVCAGPGQLLRGERQQRPLVRPRVLGRQPAGSTRARPLFDIVGRKPMISGTYLLSGLLFFFASAGASSANLTVSETWPIEIRAEAIAVFFAIAQIFGALGPVFWGALIGDDTSRTGMVWGYVIGGLIMALGGIVELVFGIKAEGQSLETVTKPLTSVDAASPSPEGAGA
jgi:MFS family permease